MTGRARGPIAPGATLGILGGGQLGRMLALAARTGIDICPEGGAAWAALLRLRASGWIAPGERVVVFNTGTGLKYR